MVFVLGGIILLVGVLGRILLSSQTAFSETLGVATIDEEARRATERMVWELRFALPSSITLSGAKNSITYTTLEGWDAFGPIASSVKNISFANGDISMDGIVFASGIKNLTFDWNGKVLTMAVDLEKTISVNGCTQTLIRRQEVDLRL